MSRDNSHSLFVLPNNLRVLYLPFKTTSSVYISLLGKVGRRAEKENEIGMAHFLEHLSFDGTKKRPTAFEINKFLDENGVQHNAFTHAETVKYFVKTLAEKVEIGFEYLSDTFLNSLLKETEREKKIITEEHSMYLDNPAAVSERKFLKLLYPNLNIGRGFEEESKNILNFTKEFITIFKNRTYVAENFVLSVCGNISKAKTIELAKKYFISLPSGSEVLFKKAEIEKQAKTIIFHRDFKQSVLKVGFKAYSFQETAQFIYSRLLGIIMSSGFSSRLYERLRNQLNLVYVVKNYSVSYSDVGHFAIETKVNESELAKTLRVILTESQKLSKGEISQDEIEKAKNMLLSTFLFNLERVENYSQYFSRQCLFGEEIIQVKDYVEIVKNAKIKDVIAVAEEIFGDPPKVCVLTPSLDKLN